MGLYHVSRRPLGPGGRLRTNRVARDHATLLRMLGRAFAASLSEVERLRTSDVWTRHPEANQVFLEAPFERVRERVAPERPSRLACAFAWPTIELARWFRDRYVADGHLYCCSLRSGACLVRDAAYLIDNDLSGPIEDVVRRVEPQAERYWLGDHPVQIPEVLIHGSAVIDQAVADPLA